MKNYFFIIKMTEINGGETMNKGLKILTTALIIVAFFGFGYAIATKDMTGNNKKNNKQNVEINVEGNDSKTENTQTSDSNSNSTSTNTKVQQVAIKSWTLNIPGEFKKDEKYDGPWYEKKYINDKEVSMLFGYYEPNGIDDRSDKEIFEEAISEYDEDLKEAYGKGNITHKNIDKDKMCSTIYYKTSKQKILTRSLIKGKVWKTITIQLPLSENEKDYEDILDNII